MNYSLLAKIFGSLLLLLALSMLACTCFAWWQESTGETNHGVGALSITTAVTTLAGVILLIVGRGCKVEILRKEAVVVVGFGWIISAMFGALPYMLAAPGLSPTAAMFESMSGFTTTGSTVIAKLDEWPRAILMWRATTQWLGGLGILVLFVALLSYLGVGSKSLFRFESSLRLGEASQTQIRRTARILLMVYSGLTTIAIVGLMVLGMSAYDAVAHAFTAVSTGGFSPYDESVGFFRSTAIEMFLVFIMIAAGMNFLFYAGLITVGKQRLRSEEEGLWFLSIIAITTGLIVFNLRIGGVGEEMAMIHSSTSDAIYDTLFVVVSIITTTGFGSSWRAAEAAPLGYDQWPTFSIALLLLLMMIGGCAGSTAGGIKVGRVVLFLKMMRQEIVLAFRPRQVFNIFLNKNPAGEAARGVAFYIALTGAVIVVGTMMLSLFEPSRSFDTCFSATVATLFNIGPGIEDVGPTQNFSGFSPQSYVLMTLLMVLGRLEMFAVLVLFVPALWRRY